MEILFTCVVVNFKVEEIDSAGNIARITSFKQPRIVPNKDACEKDVTKNLDERIKSASADMESLLDANYATKLIELLKRSKNGHSQNNEKHDKPTSDFSLTFPPETDKLKRKQLHQFIRKHFGSFLVTDTLVDELATGERVSCVRAVLHSKTVTTRTTGRKRKQGIVVDWRSAKRRDARTNENSSSRPKFLRFVLYKENIETHYVTNKIAKYLSHGNSEKVRRSFVVNIAGTKDKRGVTSQFMTINKPYREELVQRLVTLQRSWFSSKNVLFGNFEPYENCLRLGDLSGNKFVITIRRLSSNAIASRTALKQNMSSRVESIKTKGFLNYFGLQRFGCRADTPTHLLGLCLLTKSYPILLELLFKKNARDNANVGEAKEIITELFSGRNLVVQDAKLKVCGSGAAETLKALEISFQKMPSFMTAERSILKFLIKCLKTAPHTVSGGEFGLEMKLSDICSQIPYHLRNLYQHAVQSLICNQAISERMKLYGQTVVVGDLVQIKGGKIVRVTDENLSQFSPFDVVLPQPGYDILFPTSEISEQFYYNQLRSLISKSLPNCCWTTLGKSLHQQMSVPGSYRKLFVAVPDLTFKFIEYADEDMELYQTEVDRLLQKDSQANTNNVANETEKKENLENNFLALQLRFSLPQSCYATMLFRELMRVKTDLHSLRSSTIAVDQTNN